jgi:hypothetical protein
MKNRYLVVCDCEVVGTYLTLKEAKEELKKHRFGGVIYIYQQLLIYEGRMKNE